MEIGEVALQTGFKGTTDAFIESLRTDKKYFFDSSDSVLAAYREVGKRVDPQLPKLFHATPRMPYAVRAMTLSESASSTAANYMPGSLSLGTSGYFTINALGYKNEATWRTETLFVHEAMPGHHMQIARAAEIDPTMTIDPAERCISPSDFGFHNALVDERGIVRFLDFEYSGWLTEANHLGNVAYRLGRRIDWDAANLRVTNVDAAALIRRAYRKGWEL